MLQFSFYYQTFYVSLHKKMKLLYLCLGLIVTILVACKDNVSYEQKLETIDTLINRGMAQDALAELELIPQENLNEEELSYFNLLITEIKYKLYESFTSDSIIETSISYYEKHLNNTNKQKYFRSLIFCGAVNEELGNYNKAVYLYNKAENCIPDSSYYWMAYAKMRMAYVYQEQIIGSSTIALQKFKEANTLFRKIHDSHYELLCTGEMGNIYRSMPQKGDSAVFFIEKAIQLSKQQNEPYLYFSNCFKLAEYYSEIKHDYKNAKDFALKALSVDKYLIDHPRAHLCLATSYMELNQYDSAQYYIKCMPHLSSKIDSMWYYHTLSKFEEHNNNYHKSIEYYKKSHNLSDSMVVNTLNHKLLEIEKKYDKQEEELKNTKLTSRLNRTLFILFVMLSVLLLFVIILIKYRHRIKVQKEDYFMVTSELDSSLKNLTQMQYTIDNYKKQIKEAEQNTATLTYNLGQLKLQNNNLDNLRNIIDEQIKTMHQLLLWSHEFTGEKFSQKFYSILSVPYDSKSSMSSYWKDLQTITNNLYDNVLEKANEIANGTLREDEINLIALLCYGYTRTGIMVFMRHKNVKTINNKKHKIAEKLNVTTVEDFVRPFQNAFNARTQNSQLS